MQTINKTTTALLIVLGAAVLAVDCQDVNSDSNNYDVPANIPYYMQSPIANNMADQQQQRQLINISEAQQQPQITQRQTIPVVQMPNINEISQQQQQQQQQQLPPIPIPIPEIQTTNTLRNNGVQQQVLQLQPQLQLQQQQQQQQQQQPTTSGCLYDKSYFAKFDDECLARKPYPTIGLPAYKNEDLLIKRGLSERHGCVFILSNGLFKNYHLTKYSVDSDSQCLDGGKVQLSMQFSNVSLYYLWTLRCLNYADQLLADATLNGKTILSNSNNKMSDEASAKSPGGICVGSSQNFGFTSLQLTNIEAQVELATDIYKNWRITNVTVAMLNNYYSPNGQSASNTLRSLNQPDHGEQQSSSSPPPPPQSQLPQTHANPLMGTGIKDFTFESLDSDELNWRYMHLFQNWARNRMHTNFLEQYKRFLWLSMQRCLSESSEKLPVKLMDLFANHKYN